MAKDKAYHFQKLKDGVQARIANIKFRTWDPLTAWLESIGKRAAEISADIVQKGNDFFIDSAKGVDEGQPLRRRLEGNEGVPPIEAQGADDGTVRLGRNTGPATSYTFPAGSVSLSPPRNPATPTATRPVFVNRDAFTIAPGETSWVVAFEADADSVGTDTNLPAGTVLQVVSQGNLLDTAVVETDFTTGRDQESEDDYKRRGKLAIRSRTKATDDALELAAIEAGAVFVHIVEDFTEGATPVTIYAAGPDGTLSAGLRTNILLHVNGNGLARTDPEHIPMARAKGIFVDVAAATAQTFDFTIPLVLESWVIDTVGSPLLTNLRADIVASITAYIKGLNDPGNADRVMRVNRVRDIVMNFRQRGVKDIADATFLPAANVVLGANETAVMGEVTWP